MKVSQKVEKYAISGGFSSMIRNYPGLEWSRATSKFWIRGKSSLKYQGSKLWKKWLVQFTNTISKMILNALKVVKLPTLNTIMTLINVQCTALCCSKMSSCWKPEARRQPNTYASISLFFNFHFVRFNKWIKWIPVEVLPFEYWSQICASKAWTDFLPFLY